MGKKLNFIVLVSLLFVVFYCGQALAEEGTLAMTTVTTVDFRYNSQAPVGYFEVEGVDGEKHVAFCGWHEKKLPEKGWKMTTLDIYTAENQKNENLRKVLWYGFDGPGNIGANYAQTALAASVALGHMDTDDTGETEGPIGKIFLAQVKRLASPPEEFQVYCVRNLEETEYKHQCLVYYMYHPTGEIKVEKKSADRKIVEENSCYRLENAIYGVFRDVQCTDKVGELITDPSGETNTMEVKEGTYYLKELKSPSGYKLDEVVKSAVVTSNNLTKVCFEDEPYIFKVEDIVCKYDDEIGHGEEGNLPQGAASLAGAEYKIDFYAEIIESIEEAVEKVPLRSWIMKTDSKGRIKFSSDYLIEGDEMWTNDTGEFILPLGTVVVREITASKGYLVNPEKHLQTLTVEKMDKSGNIVALIESAEKVIKGDVQITKYYSEKNENVPIEGIVFVLKSKTNGKEYRIVTDKTGKASTADLGGLPYDIYEVSEENTPDGYLRNDSFEVVIDEEGEILSYDIENKLVKGRISLTKIAAENQEPLEGAKFEVTAVKDVVTPDGKLRAKAGEVVDVVTTDEEGKAATKELYLGDYMVRERKAPEGFALSDEVFSVTLSYIDAETALVIEDIGVITNERIKAQIKPVEKTKEESGAIVKTGDMNRGGLYSVLLLLSVGLFLIRKRIKK